MGRRFEPGDVLAFSAGSSDPARLKFRRLDRACMTSRRISACAEVVPELKDVLGRGTPAVISACPVPTGPFTDAVFVDSYVRPPVVSAALELLAGHGHAVVLFASPLVAAHLLLRHGERDLPESLTLVLGGYHCPASLEAFLRGILQGRVKRVLCVHAYGVAEVGVGLLVGQRLATGDIAYAAAHPGVTPVIVADSLVLRTATADVDTGDRAYPLAYGRMRIHNPPSRLSPRTEAALEQWGREDWQRRTGHLTWTPRLRTQLRPGVRRRADHEVSFGRFVDAPGMSWLDKPRWGESSMELVDQDEVGAAVDGDVGQRAAVGRGGEAGLAAGHPSGE